MNPLIANLFNAIENLEAISPLKADELLEQEGHDLNLILSETALLKDKLQRTATMRLAIAEMTTNQVSALIEIATALHLDSDVEFRPKCQMAFIKLLNLSSYHYQDPELITKRILKND